MKKLYTYLISLVILAGVVTSVLADFNAREVAIINEIIHKVEKTNGFNTDEHNTKLVQAVLEKAIGKKDMQQCTVEDVIKAYQAIEESIKELCAATQETPEIVARKNIEQLDSKSQKPSLVHYVAAMALLEMSLMMSMQAKMGTAAVL